MIEPSANGNTEISLVVNGVPRPIQNKPVVTPPKPLRRVQYKEVEVDELGNPVTNDKGGLGPVPTLEEMVINWRKSKEGLKPGTLEKLDAQLTIMRRYVDTKLPVTEYTPQKIREFVAKARADKDRNGERRLKGQTINTAILLPLRKAFALAVEDSWIDRNPADTVVREKPAPINRVELKWQEAQRVMESIKERGNHESYLELKFMWLLGVGQGEAKDITGGAIDWESKTISFTRQKTGKAYKVPIYPWAEQFIHTEIEPLFKKGEPLFKWRNPRKALETACKREDLPNVDVRSLRRTLIIHLIQSKVDVRLIARWQGHTDARLILSRYGAHIDADYEKNAMEELGKKAASLDNTTPV